MARPDTYISPWDPAASYDLRARWFFASACFHVLAVAALVSIPVLYPNVSAVDSKRPVYDELVKPDEHKIVWYAPPKTKLPEVTAVQRVGTSPTPRGREFSKDVLIATAPKAASTKQFIWRPVPKVEIHRDLDAPNMVLKLATAVPVPAPPPPPEPKKVAPTTPEGVRAKLPNPSPPNPQGDVNHAIQQASQPVEVPQPRKAFVPPSPSKQPPKLPVPVTVAELPVPDASITGSAAPKNPLPAGFGAPVISKGAPPPPNAEPGPTNSAGNAKMDLAIAGLNPSDKLNGPLPEGGRPAQFSRAPNVGETATGEVGSGVGVPGLTMREGKPADPPKVNTSRKTLVYADRLKGIPLSTLSVPLRPAARTIPRAIDSRFTGRNVYTMVVPIEDIPPYSGDWILWFAEHEPKPGDTPFVRAPIPSRKLESVEPVLPGARTELRVQIAGIIRRDGKIDSLALLRNLTPGLEKAVLDDLKDWEFKPATRDGVPVDVDVVLEVPYSLPPQIARGTQ